MLSRFQKILKEKSDASIFYFWSVLKNLDNETVQRFEQNYRFEETYLTYRLSYLFDL